MLKQLAIVVIALLGSLMALRLPLWEGLLALLAIIFIIYQVGKPT